MLLTIVVTASEISNKVSDKPFGKIEPVSLALNQTKCNLNSSLVTFLVANTIFS